MDPKVSKINYFEDISFIFNNLTLYETSVYEIPTHFYFTSLFFRVILFDSQ